MAYRPNPNDPFITPPPGDDFPRATDPAYSPASVEDRSSFSGTRIALYALAVLALVGALFYGMSTGTNNDTASNPAQNNVASQQPATPPASRDVTPRPNSEPGMTTGAAPAAPAPAPSGAK